MVSAPSLERQAWPRHNCDSVMLMLSWTCRSFVMIGRVDHTCFSANNDGYMTLFHLNHSNSHACLFLNHSKLHTGNGLATYGQVNLPRAPTKKSQKNPPAYQILCFSTTAIPETCKMIRCGAPEVWYLYKVYRNL